MAVDYGWIVPICAFYRLPMRSIKRDRNRENPIQCDVGPDPIAWE